MISSWIELLRNSLKYKNANRRENNKTNKLKWKKTVLLAASFKLRLLHSSHKPVFIQILYLIYEFFKNHQRKRIFWNASLNNLENVLQRSVRKDRARECIFRVSGSTNFDNCSGWYQPWWHLCSAQKNSGYIIEIAYLQQVAFYKKKTFQVHSSVKLIVIIWFDVDHWNT